jgi:hypothetical protein
MQATKRCILSQASSASRRILPDTSTTAGASMASATAILVAGNRTRTADKNIMVRSACSSKADFGAILIYLYYQREGEITYK